MAFADELNLMASECLETLSAGRTIVVRTRVLGAMDAGTGKRTDTETNTTVTAIRGPDENRWLGGSMRIGRVYQIAVASFEALNLQSAMVIDGTDELEVAEFRLMADKRMYLLMCLKKG